MSLKFEHLFWKTDDNKRRERQRQGLWQRCRHGTSLCGAAYGNADAVDGDNDAAHSEPERECRDRLLST